MFNNEAEYAATRLGNSVVRLKSFEDGGVFFVNKVIMNPGSKTFSKAELLGYSTDFRDTRLPSEKMEFAFGSLGYMTTEERGLTYLARVPLRRDYKQGLRSNQLVIVVPDKKGARSYAPSLKEGEIQQPEFLTALAKCAHNRYDRFDACVEKVEETGFGFGLSKHFAICANYELAYRGEVIGKLLDSGLLKLKTEFNFLEEELAEEVGHERLAK